MYLLGFGYIRRFFYRHNCSNISFMRNSLILLLFALCVSGCAVGRAAVYTETGLRAAESQWDTYYNGRLTSCQEKHNPGSVGAEKCFGSTYDANKKVNQAIRSSVIILRTYWLGRAAGEKPDLERVVKEIKSLVKELPPEAKSIFSRVKGIK